MKRNTDNDDGSIKPVLDNLTLEERIAAAQPYEIVEISSDELKNMHQTRVFPPPIDGPALVRDELALAATAARVRKPYAQMANAAWRMLEEQRMHALEVAAECADAITVLEAKRNDALRAADMCVAGQQLSMEGI